MVVKVFFSTASKPMVFEGVEMTAQNGDFFVISQALVDREGTPVGNHLTKIPLGRIRIVREYISKEER